MAISLQQFGLDQLSVEDRLELLGLLWVSLHEGESVIPQWHIEELERRIKAHNANPTAGVTWEEFKKQWVKSL